MSQVGDNQLTIQVTAVDINASVVGDVYQTSLGKAVIRQVQGTNNFAAISLGSYSMNINGVLYNLDVQSIAFCNTEVAGIKVTIPYTAYLTVANLI